MLPNDERLATPAGPAASRRDFLQQAAGLAACLAAAAPAQAGSDTPAPAGITRRSELESSFGIQTHSPSGRRGWRRPTDRAALAIVSRYRSVGAEVRLSVTLRLLDIAG